MARLAVEVSSPKECSNMSFLDYWRAIKTQLDEEFVHLIPEFFENLSAQEIEAIHGILKDGKRVRGCLVSLMSHALGGKIEDAIPRAMAIECIQAASLIHDDYVDGDTVRRNRPAVWTIEGPRKAVLLGDVIFATALQKMIETSQRDGLVITQAIATTAAGAYRELHAAPDLAQALAEGKYRREHYNLIIHLKTGALFGAASQLGAISAGASSELSARAFKFGSHVGEAYQIADDLEEVMNLEAESEQLSAKMSLLTPVFLYFSRETDLRLARLLDGKEDNFQSWLEQVRTVLKMRMGGEIANRLERATSEIRHFPENCYTKMLDAAPSEIVRMIQKTTSSEAVTN